MRESIKPPQPTGSPSTKAQKQSVRFNQAELEKLKPTEKRQFHYDETPKYAGLAVEVSPASIKNPKGRKSFYYFYRLVGRGWAEPSKKIYLGTWPTMTIDQAREMVRELSAQVAQGQDPAKERKEAKTAVTVEQILTVFLSEYAVKLKDNTRIQYEMLARLYIIPKLGKLRVEAVEHRDIARLHHEMRNTPTTANRAVAVLSCFFNWCEANGYRERRSNPVPGLKKNSEKKRTEFLSSDDLGAIGAALADLEQSKKVSPILTAALRVLILTGARKTEILSLKWSYLDLEAGLAKLPDSKTGFKVIQLPAAAVEVLKALPRLNDEYVFPSFRNEALTPHVCELRPTLNQVLAKAGIEGQWRVHDLRHALASVMVNSGASLPVVGKILGHSQASTTQRYAHLEVNPARQALETAVAKITEGWNKPPAPDQPPDPAPAESTASGIIKFRPRKAAGG